MKIGGLILMLMLAGVPGWAQGNLQATLDKLDAASARFNNAEAKVHRDAYTKFVDEHAGSDGTMYLTRAASGAVQFGLNISGKDARTIEYKSGTVRAYNPGIGCYDTVNKAGIDTYVTLGFGGSGKDLASKWDITDLGPDTINGTKVEKLDLAPKDADVKTNISKVSLWVDLDRDVSLKQVFFMPNKDTNTATYTDIRLNQKSIGMKPYEIKGKPCK
jgi:hypothetical protein